MALKQVLDILEVLDRPNANADDVAELFSSRGLEDIEATAVEGDNGVTEFLKLRIPGATGRMGGGNSPTMGVVGMGGRTGRSVDAEGIVATLALGLKLADLFKAGETLSGDMILTTLLSHTDSANRASPLPVETICESLVEPEMEAILSIEGTKDNRIINTRGIAISPTVKAGYVLRVSEALLSIQEWVTGRPPAVFAVTTQDITPWANELYHLNTIVQPATVTDVPLVGVAITSETVVPEIASGSSHEVDIEVAVRFVLEAAKAYTSGRVKLFDQGEFDRLERLYGTMSYLQAPRRVR